MTEAEEAEKLRQQRELRRLRNQRYHLKKKAYVLRLVYGVETQLTVFSRRQQLLDNESDPPASRGVKKHRKSGVGDARAGGCPSSMEEDDAAVEGASAGKGGESCRHGESAEDEGAEDEGAEDEGAEDESAEEQGDRDGGRGEGAGEGEDNEVILMK